MKPLASRSHIPLHVADLELLLERNKQLFIVLQTTYNYLKLFPICMFQQIDLNTWKQNNALT